MANPAVAPGAPTGLARFASWAGALDERYPQAGDGLLAVGVATVGAAWLALHNPGGAGVWVINAGLVIPLAWRRRFPLTVFALLGAVAFVQWLTSSPLLADVSLLVAVATLAMERPLRWALGAAAVVEAGVIMASLRWTLTDSWDRSLLGLSGLVAVALLLGAVLRTRRDRLAELTERAARLEVERDHQAQIAAAAERTRIAREMHDVIAHSLAVIVTMSDGAAAKLRSDPERAARAIGSISEVGRQALADTRRLVGVLRSDGAAELAPQPGLAALDQLVAQVRQTGLEASLSYGGTPFSLSPASELTVFRLVQEATTNTLKHARGATRLLVAIRFERPSVHVDVTDDGRPGGPRSREGGGHGLAGMRERVALYGGSLRAGPAPGGGWSIHASLQPR